VIVVPIRTGLGLNSRQHWAAKAARVADERRWTAYALCGEERPALPCVVTLWRFGPSNGLDDDNLAGSLKHVRDQIADWLVINDRWRHIVRYEYRQLRRKAWGVGIEFAPMGGQVPALLAGEAGRPTT